MVMTNEGMFYRNAMQGIFRGAANPGAGGVNEPTRTGLGKRGRSRGAVFPEFKPVKRRGRGFFSWGGGAALLLAAVLPLRGGVVISEFLADNVGGLRDEDGDSSDWIELHNPEATPVSLTGWHLTDDPDDLTRWTFPETTLPPDGYLVVFASGKDRAEAGAELHANFQLSRKGEFLALVRPDGTTIEHAFAPAYPVQRANVSFGPGREIARARWITNGAPARFLAPVDDRLGEAWRTVDFAADDWARGPMPLGYETAPGEGASGEGTPVLRLDFNDEDDGESGADNTEAGFQTMTLADPPATFDGITVTLEALGGAKLDDRDRAAPVDDPPAFTQDQLYDDFIFANGTFEGAGLRVRLSGLPPETDYRLTVWSFDPLSAGARVSDWIETASGRTNVLIRGYTFDGTEPPANDGDDTFTAVVRSSPEGTLRIEGRRHGGRSHGVFLNALQLTPIGYGGALRTDVGAALRGRNSTLYLRVPFTVEDPAAWERLRLRARYDDGFVAYLNGRLLAARLAPENPVWNSAATGVRPARAALTPEDFLFVNPGRWLVPGRNVLAVQALNVRADDDDFLCGFELEGSTERRHPARCFQPPTPGAPNDAGYAGWVKDTRFSVDRGFFAAPFLVTVETATEGAEIRWTTDGSAPGPTHGRVYTGPIPVSGTTTLRAAAFLSGYLPTDVDTQTYVFLDQVTRQAAEQPGYPERWQAGYPADYGMDPEVVNHPRYGAELQADLRAIPTLSIVADHDDLWGDTRGIYNHATRSGVAWERPASVELIGPTGESRFQVNCGLRMQGHASRDNVRTPKHSFRLLFRGRYGPAKLRYRWFPDTEVAAFNTLVLRACFTDAWTTRYSPGNDTLPLGARYRPEDSLYLRDIWMKDSQLAMGWPSAHNTFVHLYLNGLYWGLYNVCERLDASYFAATLGGREEDWDVIRDFHELLDGSRRDWDALMARVNAGIHSEADYQALRARVNIENLIDYMILHFYGEAEDWPHHNWYAAHRRASATRPATPWIFLVWDQEIVLDRLYRRNRVGVDNNNSPARIYAQLRKWPEFRREFGDRLQRHLFHDGALATANAIARMRARAAQIERAIVGESARWGDARREAVAPNPGTGETFTRDEWWRPELEKLYTEWFPGQAALTLKRCREAGLYPALGAPELSPFGGPVPANFALTLSHTNRTGRILYTLNGPDPRVYGSGEVAVEARTYTAPVWLSGPTRVRTRVWNAGEWSALVETTFYPAQDWSGLVLSEIMYHPPAAPEGGGDALEFVELWNAGQRTLDLTGLRFTEGIRAELDAGVRLPAGGYLVLAANPEAFAAAYPDVPVAGAFAGRLANGGERLTLADAAGAVVWSVAYDDAPPWPPAADGDGASLQRRGRSGDPNDPAQWLAAPPTPGGPPPAWDGDGDGLPDAWERAHQLNPDDPADADADADHDGLRNRDEYLAGTDPQDARSVLALRLVETETGGWGLAFRAAPGVVYVLERAEDCAPSRWEKWREFSAARQPLEHRVPLGAASGARRFYRLKAVRP